MYIYKTPKSNRKPCELISLQEKMHGYASTWDSHHASIYIYPLDRPICYGHFTMFHLMRGL